MTTTVFISIMIISALIIFFAVTFSMMEFLDREEICFAIGAFATILFITIFLIATPNMEQMIENNYYAMIKNRPKCIDAVDVSLGCKKDYIDWQKDSIYKQHKYDSVKIKLENLQNSIIHSEDKTEPTNNILVKTCIDSCWTNVLDADVKKCQNECFK